MKKITFLLAAILFAGVSMAQTEVNLELSFGSHKDGKITWKAVGGNITVSQLQGLSTSAVNANYVSAPRLYKGHILKFECAPSYTITKITMQIANDSKYVGSNIQVGNVIKDDTLVVNNTSIYTADLTTEASGTHTFTLTNPAGESIIGIQNALVTDEEYKQLRPVSIKITYVKTASSTPVISSPDVNFNVVNLAEQNTQELNVTGENLTDAITATLKEGTAFSVSGSLTAAGGTLIITLTATEEGTYTDVLTLKSGETTKDVSISATAVKLQGAGTAENPYTVSDVFKLNNPEEEAWVKGYIIGAVKSGYDKLQTSDITEPSNIVLADDPTATTNYICVQLVSQSIIRGLLNLVDNPQMLGAQVAIKGTLATYYNKPGIKPATDSKIISTPATALDNITVENKVTKTIINGQVCIIREGKTFTLMGQEVK